MISNGQSVLSVVELCVCVFYLFLATTYLQRVVNTGTKGSMNGFPKFWLVSSDVNMTDHRLDGRKDIISRRPKTGRHDNFFPHKNPR